VVHDVITGVAKDKRRVEIASGAVGISNSFIDMDFDKGQVVNVHGLRVEVALEPENADANANGVIAVYVLPGGLVQNSDLPTTLGTFGDEKSAPYLWGIHVWAAANQTVHEWLFAPKTSRNIQAGGRVVVDLRVEGISAGLVRQLTLMTCFTSPVP